MSISGAIVTATLGSALTLLFLLFVSFVSPVEAVAALGNKVVESLRAQDPSEGAMFCWGTWGDTRQFPLQLWAPDGLSGGDGAVIRALFLLLFSLDDLPSLTKEFLLFLPSPDHADQRDRL